MIRPSLALIVCVWIVSALPAAAQPSMPLFGRRVEPEMATQVFDFSFSALVGHDDNQSTDFDRRPIPIETIGAFTAFSPHLHFLSKGQRVQVGATAASEVRYYRQIRQLYGISHSVGLGVNASLTRRTELNVNQDVVYSPAFLFRLFPNAAAPQPGDVSADAPAYNIAGDSSYAYTTTVDLKRNLNSRTALALKGEFRYTTFQTVTGDSNARSLIGGPEIRRDVRRNTVVRIGYVPQYSENGFQRAIVHGINIGVEYERPQSATRRTSVALNVGPTLEQFSDTRPSANLHLTQYGYSADFVFRHQFDRTWSMRGAVRRGIEFTELLATPVTTNGGTLAVSGRLFPRTSLDASGSYSAGSTVIGDTSSKLWTYSAAGTIRFSLTRITELSVQYVRYQYLLTRLQPTVLGVPDNLQRNALRAGLTMALPVWRQ